MKRLLFLLLLAIPAFGQTTTNGRIMVGTLATRPRSCAVAHQFNTTDGHGAYICNPTPNNWQQLGGGGQNYQTVESQSTPLAAEPKLNFLSPMICTDHSGNLSTDCSVPVAVGVGASHKTGLVPDPDASGTATDYLGRDMSYHAAVSAATVLPDPTVGLQYVAITCNGGTACSDSNDGLSWGSAKATVYAALLALPNGSASPPQAGNGVVHIANDVNGVPFGGPVPGGFGGWWMFGPTDPNYAAGKTGWMRAPTSGQVTVECGSPRVGIIHQTGGTCPEYWGGHADNVHPPFWFNAISGQAILRGFGFAYEATGGKLGIDSNGSRTAGLSEVWLDQISMNFGSCYQGIGAGPGLDIGGNSFWISITHSSFSGCVTQDYNITAISRTSNVVTVTLDHSGTGDISAGNNSLHPYPQCDRSYLQWGVCDYVRIGN